jgi:Asp-tRNA(Asn)/Glu-tRNA(Gln) amidotransferase A subunit family amidase
VPPRIAELDDEREYNRLNLLILRNTAVGNFLDRCAISLPCHRPGEPPVGLMLMGETLGDARLFSIAGRRGSRHQTSSNACRVSTPSASRSSCMMVK